VIRRSIVCDAKVFLEQKEAAKIKSLKEMQAELVQKRFTMKRQPT